MKDAIGNELAAGDLVQVNVNNQWIGPGTVVKIQNGGIAMSGVIPQPGQQIAETKDTLVIQIVAISPGPAGMPNTSVLKIAKPDNLKGLVQ